LIDHFDLIINNYYQISACTTMAESSGGFPTYRYNKAEAKQISHDGSWRPFFV